MKCYVLLTIALLGSLVGCQNNPQEPSKPDVVTANMDTTVKPGNDFSCIPMADGSNKTPYPMKKADGVLAIW
ncbi:hypothetical protein [Paraflavitalea speifideaquila]|uniref:hypothetical protein n=1 Tax=Paraflavitalea speifideaquila TaxID=3076558 RepID=UPI0028E346B4|nr:hypothetical protein [Paraflavitalea speifideiaquila]